MDWIVLTPALIAIVLAMWTRQVYLSLFAGLWLGATIIVGGNPIAGLRETVDQIVLVFLDAGNTRVIIFCLLVGGLIALVQASGGVVGFVESARGRGWGNTRRSAELLAWLVGLAIFVESSITSLATGAVARPFFDRLKLPREKLAYYCDAMSAPVCMSIPLNGWGAYVLGLLAAQGMGAESVPLLVRSLIFNFFSWMAILFALFLAISGWGFGAMKKAERRAAQTGEVTRPGSRPMMSDDVANIEPIGRVPNRAYNLLIPILVLVGMIFVGLFITGEGNLMAGSGSTSVLWAVGASIGVAAVMYALPLTSGRAAVSLQESTDLVLKGSAGLVGVTVLIVFAFALGQISRALEMGPYLVSLIGSDAPVWWLPSIIFLVACIISFTLGSSWTCFAIMIPIALPIADGLAIDPALMLGAVLSGGVFGDHASPLSDTTIISSMSAACDHIDHVNTQLPYTLVVAAVALVAFTAMGLLL